MTPTARRILLWVLALLGLHAGRWAASSPSSFQLALAAASALAARSAGRAPGRVVALAWIVCSVPRLGHHLHHPAGLSVGEAVAQVVALGPTVVLALPLLLPVRESTPVGVPGAIGAGAR